jgi:hypothetical protein
MPSGELRAFLLNRESEEGRRTHAMPIRASQKLTAGLYLTLPNSPRACHLRPGGATRRPAVVFPELRFTESNG